MEPPEDLSARILLRQILSTEPPRTPVTRRVSTGQGRGSVIRRSSRLSQKAAGQTPQSILRRSLKLRLTESLTTKSLAAPQGSSTVSTVQSRKDPASTSMFGGETPRLILRNILQTEPAKSPVVHDQGPSEEQKPPPATSSSTRTRPSLELSALDLPDVTIALPTISTRKGLSRKRPRRSLNVTAFEKRLRDADDADGRSEESSDDSSLPSSSMSLTLKTPFVDIHTEKKGLQRKVSHRRKISEEEFIAAVNNRQMGGAHSLVCAGTNFSETVYSDGFTLNLSKASEPDLTTDILNCNTALYPQPDATTSNFSIAAAQDRSMVVASQLRTGIERDGVVETERRQSEGSALDQGEEEETPDEQNVPRASQSTGVGEEEAQEAARGELDARSESTSEDREVASDSQPDEEEGAAEPQPEEHVDAAPPSREEDVVEDLHSEQEKESEAEGDEGADVPDDDEMESETEGDKDSPESQTGDEAELQSQEDVEIQSQEDENVSESEEALESGQQSSSLLQNPLDIKSPMVLQPEADQDQNQPQDEEDEEQVDLAAEHISRRSRHSGGALVVPVMEGGEDEVDVEAAGAINKYSKTHGAFDLGSLDAEEPQSSDPSSDGPDQTESSHPGPGDPSCADYEGDGNKENASHAGETGERPSGALPEEAAPEEDEEQEEWEEEEEEEEEDDDDLPPGTPPFVRVKRNFFSSDPSASPAVLQNVQTSDASDAAPAAKPAQARPRTKRPAAKTATLPKSYLMSVFRHFAKTKVSADVYPVLDKVMDSFFNRLAADLETYAAHAKRKTIEVEDAVLLLKRQGHVNDRMSVEVLIEKFLRLEQRKLLIPIATSGNVVVPKKR